MGVKFTREYQNIISDLVDLLVDINDIYTFFEMPENIWKYLGKAKKRSYIETLADDLFFALGSEAEFNIGSGKIIYNKKEHILEILDNENEIGSINLI